MTTPTHDKIIIKGVTDEGEHFRPSDWAERMSGQLSTVEKYRIVYSPLLQPVIKDGYRCIALDPALKESNPALYETIMNFAKMNHLVICGEEDFSTSKSQSRVGKA